MQGLYSASKGTSVERFVIDFATVKTAAHLINTVDSSVKITPNGSRLTALGGGITVLNGCEGIDVLFLMISAMLVAPQSWRARVGGILVGSAFIFAMNQARIVGLFYAFRSDKAVFDILHGTVTPLLLIVAAVAFFAVWLNRNGSHELLRSGTT
jgi:exosortase/archaeosortase family protein